MVQLSVNLIALALLPIAIAVGPTKQFNFDVVNAQISPDGFTRDAVLINGEFPGPVVSVNKNDRVKIRTNNKLVDPNMRRSTSIHWHGFFQARTSAMDGPSFVNQCPIPP
ncbi:hypothetical protein E4T56_gene17379, partial [Termitomyces sp. T112]